MLGAIWDFLKLKSTIVTLILGGSVSFVAILLCYIGESDFKLKLISFCAIYYFALGIILSLFGKKIYKNDSDVFLASESPMLFGLVVFGLLYKFFYSKPEIWIYFLSIYAPISVVVSILTLEYRHVFKPRTWEEWQEFDKKLNDKKKHKK